MNQDQDKKKIRTRNILVLISLILSPIGIVIGLFTTNVSGGEKYGYLLIIVFTFLLVFMIGYLIRAYTIKKDRKEKDSSSVDKT